MIIPKLNPVTRKRLRRFKKHRRAAFSLLLLAGLFALSLCAELLCNDRPLAIRWNNSWYFPAFQYHPENTFLGNGIFTRPDYKSLQKHPAAADSLFIFAPIPFGPYETIDPESIPGKPGVEVLFKAVPRMLAVYIRDDLSISRIHGAAFVDDPQLYRNRNLDELFKLYPELLKAIELRFNNKPAPALNNEIHLHLSGNAEINLREFTPRSAPPRTVRLNIRDPGRIDPPLERARFGDGVEHLPAFWNALTAAQQQRIRQAALNEDKEAPPPSELTAAGYQWLIEINREEVRWPHPPVRGHWLGIDSAGRDVLVRLLYGLRISLSFALILVICVMVLGSILGGLQGYYGGKVDLSGQRLTEIWSALPFLYVMILLGSVYGRSFGLLLLCYALFNWIGLSYYMRAEFLRLRNQPFVEAAHAIGLPTWKIMLRHILPNAMTPLITLFPFALVGAISALAGLDYLGFGLPPPTPSWGEMLHQAQQYRWAWWLITYPSVALFTVILLGVFVGEGVREAYDPKPYSRME